MCNHIAAAPQNGHAFINHNLDVSVLHEMSCCDWNPSCIWEKNNTSNPMIRAHCNYPVENKFVFFVDWKQKPNGSHATKINDECFTNGLLTHFLNSPHKSPAEERPLITWFDQTKNNFYTNKKWWWLFFVECFRWAYFQSIPFVIRTISYYVSFVSHCHRKRKLKKNEPSHFRNMLLFLLSMRLTSFITDEKIVTGN